MRIGIITDVHANLPAFEVALGWMDEIGCEQIYHLGDLIGIGPFPKECVDLALRQSNMKFIMGNHDYWYANGLPQPRPDWMSQGEIEHQKWTHHQLGEIYKPVIQKWPFEQNLEFEGLKLHLCHYALNAEKNWFAPIIKAPTTENLDYLFKEVSANFNLLFYGHHHPYAEHEGKRKYINPGALGCFEKPVARGAVLKVEGSKYEIDFFQFLMIQGVFRRHLKLGKYQKGHLSRKFFFLF